MIAILSKWSAGNQLVIQELVIDMSAVIVNARNVCLRVKNLGQYLVRGKVGVLVLSKVKSSGNIELCHEVQPGLEQM